MTARDREGLWTTRCSLVVMGDVQSSITGLRIVPNPLSDVLATPHYSLPASGLVRLSIHCDVTGCAVVSQNNMAGRNGSARSDLRHLGTGVYPVEFDGAGLTASRKLIVRSTETERPAGTPAGLSPLREVEVLPQYSHFGMLGSTLFGVQLNQVNTRAHFLVQVVPAVPNQRAEP